MISHLSRRKCGTPAGFESYEAIVRADDPATGLKSIIAIHDLTLGPALGGCRMWHYPSEEQALVDVLRLARGMTYKSAMVDLPFGGGKAVIIGESKTAKSECLFRAFGRFVDSFKGRFITGEDVGTSVEDMAWAARETPYIVGTEKGGGDPSPITALGVFEGIKAALAAERGDDRLRGVRVAVQGLGHVGHALCALLHGAGANLVVTDISREAVDRARNDFGAEAVKPDEIYRAEADVLAPCALGGILNDETIPDLQCAVVAGSANNQLLEDRHGEALRERGILYAPDYVINAGGLINVALEAMPGGYDKERALAKVVAIADSLTEIFARAAREDVATSRVADNKIAEQRLEMKRAAVA